MPFVFLKFLHVGSMFMATALAIGPSVMLYLIARGGDPVAIKRAFGLSTAVFRAGGAFYGLGLVFGFAAALTGQLDLTARWLLTAYVLLGMLIVANLGFERWTRLVDASVRDERGVDDLARLTRARAPIFALAAMGTLTIAIVFVMVVKPSLFGP